MFRTINSLLRSTVLHYGLPITYTYIISNGIPGPGDELCVRSTVTRTELSLGGAELDTKLRAHVRHHIDMWFTSTVDARYQQPRWHEYLEEIGFAEYPELTWEQFLATRYPPSARQQAEERKRQKLNTHRAQVASYHRQERSGDEDRGQQQLQQQQRQGERTEEQARKAIWRENHGEASASVPSLPSDMWAHVHQQTVDEATQLAAWVAWADATLMELGHADLISRLPRSPPSSGGRKPLTLNT